MAIQFCPVCKNLLQFKEEKGKNIAYCNCGFKRKEGFELTSVDKIEEKSEKRGEGVAKNQDFIGVEHKCKKCGGESADVMELGERLTNESNVYLFRCQKCGTISRESDGRGNV
jgi:DNA-directed RNA polymerase subunit M/transcription elongation factor TFIIS